MDVDVTPEPTGPEREALERALALLLASREPRRSDWWRRGVRENVADERENG